MRKNLNLTLTKDWLKIPSSPSFWIFILSTSMAILWAGYTLGDRLGLLVGLATALTLHSLIFLFGDSPLFQALDTEIVLGADPWGANLEVQKVAKFLKAEQPQLYFFPSQSVNGFALALPWRRPSIGLSTGLLQKLNAQERRAVVTYLVIQSQHSKGFWLALVSVFTNTLVGLGQKLDLIWPTNYFLDRKSQIFTSFFSSLSLILLGFVRSQKSYMRADEETGHALGDRLLWAEVLWRLGGLAETKPLLPPPGTELFFAVEPHRKSIRGLTQIHPGLKDRLEKLSGYYPI